VWAADGSGEPVVLRSHNEVWTASFSPDGTHVVTATDDTARVWAADGSGKPVVLRDPQVPQVPVWSAAFSPDGLHVVTASNDGTARVWATDGSGEPAILRSQKGSKSRLNSAAFSPDGQRVVTASDDGSARVWTIGGRQLQAIIRKATNLCLEPEFRTSYFGETEDVATATYRSCQRCVGPWRRKFDQRSIRAAPDEAWKAWQQCMSQ